MLQEWIRVHLLPHMTLKHTVEKKSGHCVSQEKMQGILHKCGYPVNDYYPVSERFFKEVHHHER